MWIIVKRTVNGSNVRYIEYFKPHQIYSDIRNGFFVHCGLTWDGGEPLEITSITNADPAIVTVTPTIPSVSPGTPMVPDPTTAPVLGVTTSGSLLDRTYSTVITWTNGNGETLPSPDVSGPIPSYNVAVVTPMYPPSGATGWNCYLDILGGTNYTLQNSSPLAITAVLIEPDAGFTDTGAAPPSSNTTKGDPVTTYVTGLSDGDKIRISGVRGTIEANIHDKTGYYIVDNLTATTFELKDTDSTGWGEYNSGGCAEKITNRVTGMTHLANESVAIAIDGISYDEEMVSLIGTVS